MKSSVSFGSDPEVMLTGRTGNLVSAIGKIDGSKTKKLDIGDGHQAFYDNVLLEMNIAPSFTEDEMVDNFRDAFSRVSRYLGDYAMLIRASAKYPEKECQHPEAKVFGCEPEFCAYDLTQVLPPACEDTFRSAGGHIHLGTTEESYPLLAPIKKEDRTERDWGRVWVVRMLDLFVGIPSVLLDKDPTSIERRKLYGKAGTHRPKEEYGVEYRPLSNFWLATPRMARLIYRLCMHTVDFVGNKYHKNLWKISADKQECTGYDIEELRRTINESDEKTSRKIMEKVVKKYLPEVLWIQVFQATEGSFQGNNFYREWGI